MTAGALFASLRRRGVALRADGPNVRYVAPVGVLSDEDRAAIGAHKAELLDLLRDRKALEADGTAATMRATHAALAAEERARLEAEAHTGDRLAVLTTLVTGRAAPREACAWRLYSRRLGRALWVVRDQAALDDLATDKARDALPALFADDVERLRGLDDLTLDAVLDTCAHAPGTRVTSGGRAGGRGA